MSKTPPSFTLDVRALAAWSKLSGNESGVITAAAGTGEIAVYNRHWKEFCAAYPDEAKELASIVFKRVSVTDEHRLATASLADSSKINSRTRVGVHVVRNGVLRQSL